MNFNRWIHNLLCSRSSALLIQWRITKWDVRALYIIKKTRERRKEKVDQFTIYLNFLISPMWSFNGVKERERKKKIIREETWIDFCTHSYHQRLLIQMKIIIAYHSLDPLEFYHHTSFINLLQQKHATRKKILSLSLSLACSFLIFLLHISRLIWNFQLTFLQMMMMMILVCLWYEEKMLTSACLRKLRETQKKTQE